VSESVFSDNLDSATAAIAQPSYLHGHSGVSCTSSRHFRPHGPLHAGTESEHGSSLSLSWPRKLFGRAFLLQTRASAESWWSVVRNHAAASMEGHLPQAADRLASTRARRAAAAHAARSAGTASPRAKYISSGVCPRNAECGRTVLCSWT
jgi:hypothetical protein